MIVHGIDIVAMGDPDWDGMFQVLSNENRRRILLALLEHDTQDEPLAVPEEIHNGEQDLEDLQMELYHVHLPALENAEFIRWDRENHKLQNGPRFEKVRPILEYMEGCRQKACGCKD